MLIISMLRLVLGTFTTLLAFAAAAAPGQAGTNTLTQPARGSRPGPPISTSTVAAPRRRSPALAVRLEQFREAYSLLAGAQAVASPPIVVMAFPDQATMQPFLPLYQGKPANLTAFFNRGSDQNLIVLPLSGTDADSLKIIFHEYTHLLLRHNQPYWPMWLTEGMAEIYSTFEVSGGYHARIGNPIDHHLRLLEQTPLMPLKELFAVTRESPEYNERERQGIFYSESWLLTHYLMLGGNPAHKANFRQLTPLLRQGQPPEQAFTNALHTTLPAMEAELRRYLARGKFEPLELTVSASLETPRSLRHPRPHPHGGLLSPRATNSCTSAAWRPPSRTSCRPGNLPRRAPCLTRAWVCWPPDAGSPTRPCAASARPCSSAR